MRYFAVSNRLVFLTSQLINMGWLETTRSWTKSKYFVNPDCLLFTQTSPFL